MLFDLKKLSDACFIMTEFIPCIAKTRTHTHILICIYIPVYVVSHLLYVRLYYFLLLSTNFPPTPPPADLYICLFFVLTKQQQIRSSQQTPIHYSSFTTATHHRARHSLLGFYARSFTKRTFLLVFVKFVHTLTE